MFRRSSIATPKRANVSALTGRRRKLSDGQMIAICEQFAQGMRVYDLAQAYNVSPGVIYSICYWTPRDKDILK